MNSKAFRIYGSIFEYDHLRSHALVTFGLTIIILNVCILLLWEGLLHKIFNFREYSKAIFINDSIPKTMLNIRLFILHIN